jgi:hypothetical protein
MTMGWTVLGSNSGGARFPAHPDRPWGTPSLLYNGYRVSPGVKYCWGVLLTTHPLLVPRSWKIRAIPLPPLWATTGPVMGTSCLYFIKFNTMWCSTLQIIQNCLPLMAVSRLQQAMIKCFIHRETLLIHYLLIQCKRQSPAKGIALSIII